MAELYPDVGSEEARRLNGPSFLKIDFHPNLAGIAVRLSNGPSAGDPLDQRGTIRHFTAIGAAIEALPGLITAHLKAHDDAAEAQRLSSRG